MAERAVQIAKNILRKAYEESSSIYPYLLAYRNTEVKDIKFSPAEALLNRKLRENLPTLADNLFPKIQENVKETKERSHRNIKSYYDRSAKDLPTLNKDQAVLVRKNKHWIPGKVVQRHSKPRSYIVETEGNILRRNRKDLRSSQFNPVPYNPYHFDIPVRETPAPPNEHNPPTVPNNNNPDVTNRLRPRRNIRIPSKFKDFVM
ncbi:hypothetical protein TcasGA2_TC006861 [Tribolium castaneum]|uniref:Uncharacterized protein n=1 Tax=Tribolium castaneum TaxID=7070 RepID=D7EKK3_TRICA|nr:hypothetical protein TcasGA2_TC006861 [Tribolium castaneum]